MSKYRAEVLMALPQGYSAVDVQAVVLSGVEGEVFSSSARKAAGGYVSVKFQFEAASPAEAQAVAATAARGPWASDVVSVRAA